MDSMNSVRKFSVKLWAGEKRNGDVFLKDEKNSRLLIFFQ